MFEMIKATKQLKIIFSLFIPLFFALLKPMSMTLSQSIILGWLLLTIVWWVTEWMHKNYACFFLLIVFMIFGDTPFKSIFVFPFSDSFILVVASYMLSQGIVNSGVAERLSGFILSKYCDNSRKLVIMSFILGIILIFVIPQPFPRIILLASIYISFLNKSGVDAETKKVLLFSIFVASTVTSMMFLNGDVIINYAVMKLGGVVFTNIEWIRYMVIPTFITTILVAMAFLYMFRDYLKGSFTNIEKEKLRFSKYGTRALAIMGFIIMLWLTESYHGINSAHVALIGVGLMLAAKVISWKALKAVNVSLLIFLTAQFSIGNVLIASGVAEQLSRAVIKFFPSPESILYVPFVIFLIMVLHSIMGGLVTSASVLIPMLITITAGILPSQFIVLLTLVSVCIHYILPFQHATIMIGYGNGYYENKHTVKLGVMLTMITFIAALFIYIPWWKWTGLM